MENYILFNCPDCDDFSCVDSCKENAMAFFRGNIMTDRSKCMPCPEGKSLKDGLPFCAANCGKSAHKTLFSETPAAEKRIGAVEGLGIMGNYVKETL